MRTIKIPELDDVYYRRFWSKVNITANPDKCWEWTDAISPKGYGLFAINLRKYKAHRVSYSSFYSKDPDKLLVCHKCDNPKCVNPNHLFLGTQKDNLLDCKNKGRATLREERYFNKYPHLRMNGEKNPSCKISALDVFNIKNDYLTSNITMKKLGEKYNISRGHINNILKGKNWKHI